MLLDDINSQGDFKQQLIAALQDPDVVNFLHDYSDLGLVPDGLHHTLGPRHDQSSYGDHKHDGKDSSGILQPKQITGWIASNIVDTQEATTSTVFTDLATVGPSAGPITVGPSGAVLIILSAQMQASGGVAVMGVATTGANITTASDGFSAVDTGGNDTTTLVRVAGGLNPGDTTFIPKYRTTAGTSTFLRRTCTVIPI